MKAMVKYLLGGTVYDETFEGFRISITTQPDGRAVVVIYDEAGNKVRMLFYRVMEKSDIVYE